MVCLILERERHGEGLFFLVFSHFETHRPLSSQSAAAVVAPKAFLQVMSGRPVSVKLKWGMEYKGGIAFYSLLVSS
jgi:hypothetical protein